MCQVLRKVKVRNVEVPLIFHCIFRKRCHDIHSDVELLSLRSAPWWLRTGRDTLLVPSFELLKNRHKEQTQRREE